jgi:hypothetical protein
MERIHAGHEHSSSWSGQSLTLCQHFDSGFLQALLDETLEHHGLQALLLNLNI